MKKFGLSLLIILAACGADMAFAESATDGVDMRQLAERLIREAAERAAREKAETEAQAKSVAEAAAKAAAEGEVKKAVAAAAAEAAAKAAEGAAKAAAESVAQKLVDEKSAQEERKQARSQIDTRIFRLNHASASEVAEKLNEMWNGNSARFGR